MRLKRAKVVGGTDHFVGRLFVAADGAPSAIRVELKDEDALPLQPGDVVALIGRAATIEGERVIVDAKAALVDMQARPREVGTSVWRMPEKNGPVLGTLLTGGIARISGLVTGHENGRFVMGGPPAVEVQLNDRKGCSIEDEPTPIGAPALASRVSVTGVATLAVREGRPLVRLWPRTPEDVRVEAGPLAGLAKALAGVFGPPFRDGDGLPDLKETR